MNDHDCHPVLPPSDKPTWHPAAWTETLRTQHEGNKSGSFFPPHDGLKTARPESYTAKVDEIVVASYEASANVINDRVVVPNCSI